MGLPTTFKRPLASVPGNAPAPGSSGIDWAGIKSHQPRDPILATGEYRLHLLECVFTDENPRTGHRSCKAYFEVLDAADGSSFKQGDRVMVLAIINGKSKVMGQERVKSMFVGLTGSDEETFNAAFRAGHRVIDDTLNGAGCVGRIVDVIVRPGNKEGYYEYEWTATEGQDPFFTEA